MNVLLVGPEKKLAVYKEWIESAFDSKVCSVDGLESAGFSVLKSQWDLIVVDLDGIRYPNGLIKKIREIRPERHCSSFPKPRAEKTGEPWMPCGPGFPTSSPFRQVWRP